MKHPRKLTRRAASALLLLLPPAAGLHTHAQAPHAAPVPTGTYLNPVIDVDLPDPGVIADGRTLYLTHTMGGPPHGWGLWKSVEGRPWAFDRHLLTPQNKPAWMKSEFWAPEIHRVASEGKTRFVLTFTARSSATNRLCVGLAFSDSLTGPYEVQNEPIVSDPERNVLDSNIFQDDDGSKYFLWKRDGSRGGAGGDLRIRRLTADCSTFASGSRDITLLHSGVEGQAQQAWERGLIEAPWMMKRSGFYILFYSGAFIGPEMSYRVGVARSTRPTEGFVRHTSNPILQNNATWGGAGHGSFFQDAAGVDWHVYHARHAASPNDTWATPPGKGRVILMDRVLWDGGWPAFLGGWPAFLGGSPSTTPQIAPRLAPPAHAASPNHLRPTRSGKATVR